MKSELERLAVYFTKPYLLKSCLCGVTFLKDEWEEDDKRKQLMSIQALTFMGPCIFNILYSVSHSLPNPAFL